MSVKDVSTFKFDVFGNVREVVKVQLDSPSKNIIVADIFPGDDSPRKIESLLSKLAENDYECTTDLKSRKIICTGAY